MALRPFSSLEYQKRTRVGTSGDECCVCGRHTSGLNGAIHVPVNHERGEFVTDEHAKQMGESCSLYPIGPECVKKWRAEFAATSTRLRRTARGIVSYDDQEPGK